MRTYVCDRVRVIVRQGVSVSLSVRKHACVRLSVCEIERVHVRTCLRVSM